MSPPQKNCKEGYSPSLDNYSLDWNPPFGRIPSPLPYSSGPRPSRPPRPPHPPRPPRRGHARARQPARTYAAANQGAGPGPGTPHSAYVRDPRAGNGRAPAGQRARTRPRPRARARARRIARTSATPAQGTGAGAPASAPAARVGGTWRPGVRGRPARARRNGRGGEKWGPSRPLKKMHRGAIAPYWIITAWIGIPGSGEFLLPSRPKVCRGRPRPRAGPACCQRAWPAGRRARPSSPPEREGRRRNWEGRRAFVFAGPHGAGTYYMGRPGGRRGSCSAEGPPASGQRALAIADRGPLTEAGRTP